MLRWSIWLHKWIALVVGVQVLFWVVGGTVMTVLPIAQVRSEHHQRHITPAAVPTRGVVPLSAALAAAPGATEATLRSTPRGLVWSLRTSTGRSTALDALTGRVLPPLNASEAVRLAQVSYVGSGRAGSPQFFPTAPRETGKEGALWRVDFSDAEATSFYLDPLTGEVASRRSNVWRFYDFFWRLHIMNFGSGDNFNHPLLIGAAVVSLVVVISGFVLLWIRLRRDYVGWRSRSGMRRNAVHADAAP